MVLVMCSGKDSITLKTYDDINFLYIAWKNETTTEITTFILKLYEIEEDRVTCGDFKEDVLVEMPSSKFVKIINRHEKISDTSKIMSNTYSYNWDHRW